MELDKVSMVLSVWDIAKVGFALILAIVGAIILLFRAFKVNRRIAKNLGRRIFIFCPQGGTRADGQAKDMKREIGVLRNSGYFDVQAEPVADYHSIDAEDIEKSGIVIVGYYPGMPYFNEIVDMAKQHEKPLVIYTFELGLRLDDNHQKKLNEYKWYTLSSMPLRLVSDVFAIMASFNYAK